MVRHQLLRRNQFFGKVVYKVTDRFGLLPCATVRKDDFNLRNTSETMDILKYHILLVKRIHQAVVSAKPCIFQMLFQHTKAERVERTDIHFVAVCRDVSICKLVCNTCYQFLRSLFRKCGNEDALRPYITFLYEVDCTLHERICFAGSGTCRYEDRTVCSRYCFSLPVICVSKIKHS